MEVKTKRCRKCREVKTLSSFSSNYMKECISCREARHPHKLPSPYQTEEGRNAVIRERRRLEKVSTLLQDPRMTDLDKPRKCRTCKVIKPQREYSPRTYVCKVCHDKALAGTAGLEGIGPPRGRTIFGRIGRVPDAIKALKPKEPQE